MRLQILGGGNNQVNAIKKAIAMGHEVVLTDYLDNPPGKAYAQIHEKVSTFDGEGNLAVAKKYKVDGIMTTGTDQPVLTVTRVAQALQLPSFLDVPTAQKVTNKRLMKETFTRENIPTVPYTFLRRDSEPNVLRSVEYPAVLKPLDSQGQRGVFFVDAPEQATEYLEETLSYSKEEEALLESFYPSDEVTVSAWVRESQVHFLTLTDRKIFRSGKHIGICYAHEYPSMHKDRYEEEIRGLTQKIQKAFSIHQGPLYIQMLIGPQGIRVNEVACRIGGAYEEVFIPWLTGFDLLERVIAFSLTGEMGPAPQIQDPPGRISSQLFFAKPGRVARLATPVELKKIPGLLDAGYNVQVGQSIGTIENATARAGYMVLWGKNEQELKQNRAIGYETMGLWNPQGENLVIPGNPQGGDEI